MVKSSVLLLIVLVFLIGVTNLGYAFESSDSPVFWGLSPDWGLKAWIINTEYSINIESFGTDKGITLHRVWAYKINRYNLGDGSYWLQSVTVTENSSTISMHQGSSFTPYTVFLDPRWKVYMHDEKEVSDVMDIYSQGKATANFTFRHMDFFPTNNWNYQLSNSF
ncbi:hypothetical protein JYT99_02925 [bacterium AH-315-E09]|nr:hypothetical protein [bacterium AH-315-L21]MBN4074864.1 hypothetical protein [bacterium AH-315-E09]